MSTLKEISESRISVTIKPKEGFFLSLSRDLVTFAFIGLCIYISQGSAWWTLVTGMMFIVFAYAKLNSALKTNVATFKSHEKAIEYIKSKGEIAALEGKE